MEKVDDYAYLCNLESKAYGGRLKLLQCIKKISMVNRIFSSEGIDKLYEVLQKGFIFFKDINFEQRCLEELSTLGKHGLRPLLDDTIKSNFKEKFNTIVDSPNLQRWPELYPIYGNMLKIQLKPKILLYEEKKQKINEAVARLQMIFQNVCLIPDLDAHKIIWNFSNTDIDKLLL